MSNLHPVIEQALRPFFTLSVTTATGVKACRVQADDRREAIEQGISRLNIRDDEIPPSGLEVSVKETT